MKFRVFRGVAVFILLFSLSASSIQAQQNYLFKFVFKGMAYKRDASGNIVGTPITDQTLLADRAAAGGVDPSTLSIVYHVQGDVKGDTVEIFRNSDRTKVAFEFGFWFGDDPTLGRTALTNSVGTEVRRVDQLFTLENSTYTSNNSHGVGTVFLTKRFVTDGNGVVHTTIEGPLQWLVNPQNGNSTIICYGTLIATEPF